MVKSVIFGWALAACAVLSSAPAALGIHADEFGRREWLSRHVGTAAVAHPVRGGALVVSARTGCVAKISDKVGVRNGLSLREPLQAPRGPTGIAWRVCLPDGVTGAAALVARGSGRWSDNGGTAACFYYYYFFFFFFFFFF
jgi:hypothetical protein